MTTLSPSTSTSTPAGVSAQVDPRGLRFAAALTSLVLAAALLSVEPAREIALVLTAAQAVVFAIGAFLGVRHSPYGRFFGRVVRPRLAAPTELEDARPPQFAQAVGLAFATVALVGLALDLPVLALVALALALVAALLNAAVGFCLGCEMYLLVRRVAAPAA
ncbi:MAG: DUF4395 domain-containing protein [Aeromicrobium sp.]|uniref:DUF4395 domain-containing protein n=1 Tax=Aeromicrobium sp. TaxID=1871063 RepID=UPI0025C39880|nr:DUF4395 domain-containing protein [Aeromicrobium sp.]MCK5891415.1 DUF4395 domain-containing protein [Aeromicrobium sp.]MDF1704439.1 DUF4395 domain-containing protein [Aeromicrobium sp.]